MLPGRNQTSRSAVWLDSICFISAPVFLSRGRTSLFSIRPQMPTWMARGRTAILARSFHTPEALRFFRARAASTVMRRMTASPSAAAPSIKKHQVRAAPRMP